ncbi:phosphatidylinositol-specific phospholipase C [Streptomyces sp. 71268]|uniref:phosphatidylinositol-specific phospholipase C n=1 Tax=Streptomyces sp. 71268 TaxID=3002640 RepID=UPI0023F87D1C|nr:phosphatidylinositol-specific phospholipase C [Streptomyces sp. 71268]WEV23950.1 phosphatidylinositol-specific phospholipase C [Streptomyces sp. 71268]
MSLDRRGFLFGAATVTAGGLLGYAGGHPAAAREVPRAAPTRSPRPTGGWLADLADDTPVARLSLPGTQHSAVRFGGAQVARQRRTIADQLDLGIRFLDIGCRSSHSAFAVHHGAVFQRVLFGEVLLACEAFLRAHPSETVLLRLRQEHSTVPDAEFRRVFDLYLAGFRRLLRLDATLPTLGQARGRVVLLADHPRLPGVPYGDAALFDVQDDATAAPAVKYQKVERHLRKAAARPGKLYVNYVGTAVQGSPRANARYLNPRVHRFLTGPHGRRLTGLGVVALDFPDATPALVHTIIRRNQRAATAAGAA